jgi:hypothetical protein
MTNRIQLRISRARRKRAAERTERSVLDLVLGKPKNLHTRYLAVVVSGHASHRECHSHSHGADTFTDLLHLTA